MSKFKSFVARIRISIRSNFQKLAGFFNLNPRPKLLHTDLSMVNNPSIVSDESLYPPSYEGPRNEKRYIDSRHNSVNSKVHQVVTPLTYQKRPNTADHVFQDGYQLFMYREVSSAYLRSTQEKVVYVNPCYPDTYFSRDIIQPAQSLSGIHLEMGSRGTVVPE